MNEISLKRIEEKLIQGIADMMSLDHEKLTPDVTLAELGVDSLGLVEIFVFIEKNFNLQLLESGLTKDDLSTIRSLASYIEKRI